MLYEGEEALGLIETLGMVPAIYGADNMLKAAAVDLIAYENVGSTLVTVMVKGDVAAVQAAVAAGAVAAASIGKLTTQNVMPRPVRGVGRIAMAHVVDAVPDDDPGLRSLGMIETFGIVYLCVVFLMACVALALFLLEPQNAGRALFAVGGLLFAASDVLLVLGQFGRRTYRGFRALNLSLYYVGQVCICLTIALLH